MSTILDALRKVEQDHQAQNTDVRARLLTLPPRPQPRAPQKNVLPWVISLGLAVIGFLIGAAIIMYRPAPLITSLTAESAQSGQAAVKTSPAKQAASPLVANTPPAKPSAEPPAHPFVPTPTSQEQSAPGLASVQRSPFISGPSAESSQSAYAATPATSQTEQATYDEYIIEPLPQDVWDSENEALAPEDEAHFVSPSAEPLPASVINPAPSTPSAHPVHLDASVSLLQWSPEPAERFASITIGDGPLTMVYEGDRVGGFTIVKIHKNKVDLRSNDADGASLTLHLR
jgi:hypothetical protein